MIGIDGTIESNNWVDESSGEERSMFFVKANTLRLISTKRES